jgi:tripartite-type tricarboxylate transporter receptor subunit TctC
VALARKISDDLRTVLAQSDFQKRYEELGTYIRPTTPEQLTGFIQDQIKTWRPIIAETAKQLN